jgi:hypothetical protein
MFCEGWKGALINIERVNAVCCWSVGEARCGVRHGIIDTLSLR